MLQEAFLHPVLLDNTVILTSFTKAVQLWLSFLRSLSIDTPCSTVVHQLPALLGDTHGDLLMLSFDWRHLVTCQEIPTPRSLLLLDVQPTNCIRVLVPLCGLDPTSSIASHCPQSPAAQRTLSCAPKSVLCPDSIRSLSCLWRLLASKGFVSLLLSAVPVLPDVSQVTCFSCVPAEAVSV